MLTFQADPRGIQDASMKLSNCVIRLNKDDPPVFVELVEEGYDEDRDSVNPAIAVRALGESNSTRRIKLTQLSIPAQPFPTGMANINNSVYLVNRTPARRASLGLCNNNTTVNAVVRSDHIANSLRVSHLTGEQGFLDFLQGSYPSIREAATTESVKAFCKDYCFKRVTLSTLHILDKSSRVVGEFTRDTFHIYPPFKHKVEAFQRLMRRKGERYNVQCT